MEQNRKFKVIGIMSGTSLDGIDMAACEFIYSNSKWDYCLIKGKTYTYNENILNQLKNSQNLSGLELTTLDIDYGKYLGELVNIFIEDSDFEPDYIASHGYTVFHEPSKGITLQIGSGAEISSITGIQTICDFRTNDVALGGQGAPLVPIGDELLFAEYSACLNLGGFSNISFRENNERVAFDICPVNFVLNLFAQKLGKPFDEAGNLGKEGTVINELLTKLNRLPFYSKTYPKSLGREFVEEQIIPLIEDTYNNKDVLATFYKHIAQQIAIVINKVKNGNVLVTGGGAFNTFLIEQIKTQTNHNLVVQEKELIEYKEAIIFAFLGVLRINNIPNCLSSVTGAKYDNIGGCIYN